MIQICLCDDNPVMLKQQEALINRFKEQHAFDIKVTSFPSGEALLFYAEDYYYKFDIIILDILMGKTNGIEVANKLRKLGSEAQIIFITSSREHVFDSFDSHPLHYLLKDNLSDEQVEQVLLKAIEQSKKKEKSFLFKKQSTTYSIPLNSIIYFEIIGRIMCINCIDAKYEYYKRIDDLEKELAPYSFCRIHRSYVVNLAYIKKLNRNEVTLNNGTVLVIGKSYYNQVTKRFSQYLQLGE